MAKNSDLEQQFRNELMAKIGEVSIFWYQPSSSSRAILFTKGMCIINQHELADKTEQVYPFIELYILLPSHWDFKNANQKWPLEVIKRMINAQVNQSVWFGPGDTLPAHPQIVISDNVIDNDDFDDAKTNPNPINNLFKQNYFLLTEPNAAASLLSAVAKLNDEVNYLAIMPIYQQEFDYKTSRSALELILKFEKKNVSELIDEHRPIGAKKRFFGLF